MTTGEDGRPVRQIRVMLVDDHEVVCRGVAAVLATDPGVVVCGMATSSAEAVSLADAVRPDVILMDVRMEGGTGIDATREIRSRHPDIKIVMLTAYSEDDALFASIMAGASGYLLKQINSAELLGAVRGVGRGQSFLDPQLTHRVLDLVRRRSDILRDERLARLSPQELRILELVTRGLTNRSISQELFLAEKTVKNHISHILAKLGTVRRADAAAYFAREQARAT